MNDYVKPEAIIERAQKVVPIKPEVGQPRRIIKATQWVWRDPATIAPREFLYGRHYIRKFLSGTVAPGGLGKSSMALVEAVAAATGKPLLGVSVRTPLRVWYWNGEDPLDEIDRRLAAICLHYGLSAEDLGGRLFIDSGRDCEIVIASETRDGAVIAEPVVNEFEATIRDNEIDMWVLDPFVSVHAVSENDNGKIGAVMKTLAGVADRTNSAGELVHHVKKGREGGQKVEVEDGRGASAFIDRVRSARALSRMSKEEAVSFNVEEKDRRLLFRVEVGKANLFAATGQAIWRRLFDVDLGNGGEGPSDRVGVVTTWDAPGLFDGITNADILLIQTEIEDAKDYRENAQAKRWVGKAVAKVLDWDLGDETAKSRVKRMLAIWTRTGLLKPVEAPDGNRELRTFIRVGEWMQA